MVVLKNESGETHVRALMAYMISDLIENINVGKTMNDVQVARACDLILDEFYFLKVDDFKLCFNRVLAGKYGKSYDRIDVQVLFGWLNAYCNERMNSADESSYNDHLSHDKTIPVDDEVLKRLNSLAEKYGNHGNTL